MRNEETKLSSRILAGFLTMIMVLSLIPFSAIPAMAATADHDDAVTITVTEEDGTTPIVGATVTITVDYTKGESTVNVVDTTVETDENGVVEVLKGTQLDTYAEGELRLTASATAAHYAPADEGGSISDFIITSVADNPTIKLKSTVMTGVSVNTISDLVYTGEDQQLLTISAQSGDKVTFQIGTDAENTYTVGTDEIIPVQKKDAGDYAIHVVVEREGSGLETFDENYNVSIAQATTGIVITGKTLTYNEGNQALVTLTGTVLGTDDVKWYVDGNLEEIIDNKVPERMAVGNYTVRLVVDRGTNYIKVDKTVESEIQLAELNLGELSISANDVTYNGNDQRALTVENQGDYTLKYSFTKEDGSWVEYDNDASYPVVKDAKDYSIYVKAVKEGYNEKETPAFPIKVTVKPKTLVLSFVNEVKTSDPIEQVAPYTGVEYDFSANLSEDVSGTINYEIDSEKSDSGVASFDETVPGLLIVTKPGAISIKVTWSGSSNYTVEPLTHTLDVYSTGSGHVAFPDEPVDYVVGTNEGKAQEIEAQQTAHAQDDDGAISYEVVNGDTIGLLVDSHGKVTIGDYSKLVAAIQNANGTLNVRVKAKKAAVKNFFGREKFPADETSYTFNITFAATPEKPYDASGEHKGNSDWFTSAVVLTPISGSGYTIARDAVDADGLNFGESCTFDNQGSATATQRYVYLRRADGGITDRIRVNDVNIDTEAPAAGKMSYKIQELSLIEKIGYKFGFFNPSVSITFFVEDELDEDESGLDHVTWFYSKDASATHSIISDKSGDLFVEEKNGKYEATLTITVEELEQYRGHISFKAYDVAGNGGDVEIKQDENGDDIIVVVEKISPEMSAEFKLADSNGVYNPIEEAPGVTRHYYNGSVDFTFTVEEANFFEDDVIISVTRDGNPYEVIVNWTKDPNPEKDELNYGKFTLTGDGDYVVTMSYQDQTNMVMVDADNNNSDFDPYPYTSETITIDSEAPKISFVYNGKEDDNNNQSVTFTIVEHNFDPNSIEFDFKANDITGKSISSYANQGAKLIQALKGKREDITWNHDGDSHSITIDDFADAIYNLKISYKDLALNAYTTDSTPGSEEFETGEFIIDHTKPTDVVISYSDAYKNPWDTIVDILTLGFYNPSDNRPVTVTFVTTDDTSGIDHFNWSYKRTDGVSEVNLAELPGVIDAADIDRDGNTNTFTASITLPIKTADQLRGSITVSATDNKANKSNTVTDSRKVIVVDSISPKMEDTYSESSRTIPSGEMYYNKAATATFTVTEANFFSNDVEVTVSKNGGTPYSVSPSWVDNSQDEHVGTLVLPAADDHSDDGHYVIYVTYTDRSNNTMTLYESNTITIDTTAPTISVSYDDEKVPVVQTLDDNVRGNKANARKYYADQKVATITIVEHNFEADEVDFTIVAKDISGTVLNDPNLIEFGNWQTIGDTDTHTITITYPGDANYEFDVAYTDLATNAAADYATDFFTVDQTAPTNIQVAYSPYVPDILLNNLTFGFYNAKMTVIITADDNISGVRTFNYNYRNAEGVSSVNAELINQALEEANGDITYSTDGKTATTSFEIPKMVLGNDNQFNGTVDFTATDRSGKETQHKETKRVVVDNIAPTAQVAYNESTNKVGDIDYYNGNIDAMVTITEANFYSDDVVITVTKDGAAYNVTPTWADNSVDVHVGRFTLTEDGDYIITINYRDKSSNTMTEYKSNQLTIDTKIEEPTYTINNVARFGDDGKAYKSDATVEFNFEDQNFDTKTITLTRKRYNDETVVYDSEKTGVNDFGVKLNMNNKGGSGTITIPEEVANDGIYTLKITMTDKALHPTESYVKFAITRFGSVYEYNDVLAELIIDGGQYKQSISEDLVIKEYNAVPITNESLKITVTRDGEVIDADYTSDPTDGKQFETVGIGNSGWYEYVYTIKAANFIEDGVYNITLSSLYDALDASGNSVSTSSTSVPDNSIDADGNKVLDVMKFTVDDTAPEIRNVINLDKEIADRDQIIDGKLTVTYTIIDVGGLKTIEIIVNGSTLDTISEFEDASSYTGTLDLNESSDKQTVQIKVTDLAGNVTDTANDAFKNAHKTSDDPYVFNDTITVSTNFFVRWYANTPFFWGSIGGVVLVAGGSGAAIAAKRKKKAKA